MHRKFVINSDISKTYCNNYLLVIIALGFGFCSKAQKCIILTCNPWLIMKSKILVQKTNSYRPTISKVSCAR